MARDKLPIHDTDSTGQEDIFTEAMETEEEYIIYWNDFNRLTRIALLRQ